MVINHCTFRLQLLNIRVFFARLREVWPLLKQKLIKAFPGAFIVVLWIAYNNCFEKNPLSSVWRINLFNWNSSNTNVMTSGQNLLSCFNLKIFRLMFICPCRTQVNFWPMVIAQRSYTKKKRTREEYIDGIATESIVLFVGLLDGVSWVMNCFSVKH